MNREFTTVRGRTRLDVRAGVFDVRITARTRVEAPGPQVWDVLTDTAAYPSWNPFVRRLDGPLRRGGRITVLMQPAGRQQRLRPRVTELEPGRRFAWLGHAGVPGLLDGRHAFALEPVDGERGTTLFVQSERLSGVLVPLFRTMLLEETPTAFAALNDALAERAERLVTTPAPALRRPARG